MISPPGAKGDLCKPNWAMPLLTSAALDVLVGAGAAYPVFHLSGRAAVQSELAAMLIVLAAFVGMGGAVLGFLSRKGAAKVAYAYVMMGVPRVAVVAGLAAAYKFFFKPPMTMFLAWLIVFYLLTWTSESVLMTRALKKSIPVGTGATARHDGRDGSANQQADCNE